MKDLLAQVKAHKAKERTLEPEVAKDVQEICDWLMRVHSNPASWELANKIPFGVFACAMRVSDAIDEEKK